MGYRFDTARCHCFGTLGVVWAWRAVGKRWCKVYVWDLEALSRHSWLACKIPATKVIRCCKIV
jgi:hypothetical protein